MKPKKRAPRLHPLHPERGATHPRSFVFGATRCLVKDHDVDFTRTPDLPKNQVLPGFLQRLFGTHWHELISLNHHGIFEIYFVETFFAKVASELGHALRLRGARAEFYASSGTGFLPTVSILDVNKKCAKFLGTHGDKYCIIAPSCKHVCNHTVDERI